MGLKSIELQVAIPRTQDAGKMQEQTMKEGQQFQAALAEQKRKEEIEKRSKVNEYEVVQDKQDENEKNKQDHQHDKKDRQKTKFQTSIEHPYLGKNIDYKG